jgi:hypothetical protein
MHMNRAEEGLARMEARLLGPKRTMSLSTDPALALTIVDHYHSSGRLEEIAERVQRVLQLKDRHVAGLEAAAWYAGLLRGKDRGGSTALWAALDERIEDRMSLGNWQVVTVVNLLSKSGDEAAAEAEKRLRAANADIAGPAAVVLAKTRGEAAIPLLKERVDRARNNFEADAFMHAMAAVGSDTAWQIIQGYAAGPRNSNQRQAAASVLAERQRGALPTYAAPGAVAQ